MNKHCLLKQRMTEVVVTTGAISCAKLQSNHRHQQTNMQFFLAGRMPFLLPNQQRQSTEGKISHSMDLLTPSSPGGLPTLSLTTSSYWLPWRRVAMPLISPLMPVLQQIVGSVTSILLTMSSHDGAICNVQPYWTFRWKSRSRKLKYMSIYSLVGMI